MNRIVVMALITVAFVPPILVADQSNSNSQSEGNWLPDSKTVDRIEQKIRDMPPPTMGDWRATPVDNYGRYYTGVTVNGHKVVYGVFLSTDAALYPRGVYIVRVEKQPHMSGGGCSQLNVWYDVAEERVTEFHCYGLG